ncbi:hypothetical protein PFISCL1PPCAC_2007, partial [Pristionchus fissidentatus]
SIQISLRMRPLSQGFVIGASCIASAATITNAYLINKQFYPTMVYLTKSNASLAVMYIQSLVFVYLMFQLVRKIFFGELRASESEHLSERAWHAVMETCLAFTVFRDDFSPFFVMQFVLLLFVKSLHWLADDRVDLMERSPVITLKFHFRMLSIAACLAAIDSFFISHAYFVTLQKGASAQVVFGFEYAVMLTMVLQVVIKYLLHMYDLRSASPWEAKSLYLLHAELFINLIRCVLYLIFVVLMMRVHTLPLFSIRPFYLSLRSFHKALNDVILSRRAVHAMNNRFPVVTEAELAQMDATCIICREEMTVPSSPKRLPCSHVFHAHCLRSWFQRQQTCPTCRTDILSPRRPPTVAAAMRAAAAAQAAAPNGAPPAMGGFPPGVAPPPFPPNFFPLIAHQFGANPAAAAARPQGAAEGAAVPPNGTMPPMPPPLPGMMHPMMHAPHGFPAFPPMPGMGFPFPPPPIAPPLPPSTAGLSEEELRVLEGNTRVALEARIRVLSDISALLDAAVMQMQQYVSMVPPVVVATPPTAPTPAARPATPPAAPSTSAAAAADAAPPSPAASSNGTSTESRDGSEEERQQEEMREERREGEEEEEGERERVELELREQVRLRRLER